MLILTLSSLSFVRLPRNSKLFGMLDIHPPPYHVTNKTPAFDLSLYSLVCHSCLLRAVFISSLSFRSFLSKQHANRRGMTRHVRDMNGEGERRTVDFWIVESPWWVLITLTKRSKAVFTHSVRWYHFLIQGDKKEQFHH